MTASRLLVDASVHPFFKSNAELREYLPEGFRTRGFPDVESPWYQAPGGDYREDLYAGEARPASDPAIVAEHVFADEGASVAVLDPLTRGNLPDYLLNSRICAATNEWLVREWLEHPAAEGRFRGTIRVNPEDIDGAVAEVERWAGHPLMVQIGVPLQSREPYGKPQFRELWRTAARHRLPVSVARTGGAGIEYPPTPAGHARTYPHYAAFAPLNYAYHLTSLIAEGVCDADPGLVFVFADGGADLLTPLVWRMEMYWRALRDQTPWMMRSPTEYLVEHVRFGSSPLEGPTDRAIAADWLAMTRKHDLVMFASHYPRWSAGGPERVVDGLAPEQREGIAWRNADHLYRLGLSNTLEEATDAAR